jgi:hypothetical protein
MGLRTETPCVNISAFIPQEIVAKEDIIAD